MDGYFRLGFRQLGSNPHLPARVALAEHKGAELTSYAEWHNLRSETRFVQRNQYYVRL